MRLGRDRVQRLLAFTDADLVDDQAFSLALEEPKVQHRRRIDHLLAAEENRMIEVLDVGNWQARVLGFWIRKRPRPVIEMGRLKDIAKQAAEKEQLFIGVGR